MVYKLSEKEQQEILSLLSPGYSKRIVAKTTHHSKQTILKLVHGKRLKQERRWGIGAIPKICKNCNSSFKTYYKQQLFCYRKCYIEWCRNKRQSTSTVNYNPVITLLACGKTKNDCKNCRDIFADNCYWNK